MLNRSSICILPVATLFICPVVWLALHSDLPLNNARAAASTALPPRPQLPGWTTGVLAVGTIITIRWLLMRSSGIQSVRMMLSPKMLNRRPSPVEAIPDL